MKHEKLLLASFAMIGTLLPVGNSFAESLPAELISQQQSSIKGTVVDEKGEPLIGVSVMVEGTTTGVITDFDGNFVLEGDLGNAKLRFSYIGYITQTVSVSGKNQLSIVMKEDSKQLEEVVVVGYGTQKKANLSGSVASVGSDVLEGRPIVNAGQGLQGVIPNLNIELKSGDPSQSPTYNIRGNTSINGGGPLILVDGLPMDIDDLNPNDIKSVTVLKDAGAAAIYGARAAFGVILVETKNASEGKVQVKFGAELSLQQPIFNMEPLTDPYLYVTNFNLAKVRGKQDPAYDEAYVAAVKAYQDDPLNNPEWEVVNGQFRFYGNNNYRERVLADISPMQKYDLSVSGSGEKNKYYISFGYMDADGFYRGDGNENYKRFNVIMKNDINFNKWISADSKIVFNGSRSNKVHAYTANASASLQSFARVAPVRPIDVPSIPGYEHLEGMDFITLNMLPIIEQGGRDITKDNTIWMSQGLTLTPFEGLKIRSDFSYQVSNSRLDADARRVAGISGSFDGGPDPISYGDTANDYVSVVSNYNQYYVFNAFAEYSKKIKEHDIKAMIGYNQEWSFNTASTAKAQTIVSSQIIDVNATSGLESALGGKNQLALMGYFYRLNYSYNDRYLLEFNGRYDGTSRFPKDSRFGFFPSFSAAWRISNEKFMEGTREWLDNLKLRASYGMLGNQAVQSFYPYISTMEIGQSNYIMNGSSYTTIIKNPGLVSPSLTWESVATTNFGLDFSILNQKLDVSFDIYERRTTDMLMSVTYPSTLGITAPQENGADLRTRGWELAVKWRDNIGADFNYDVTLSLSDYQAEITKYNNPTGKIDDYYVGKKLGEIWGYETYGIFQSEDEIKNAPSQAQIDSYWIPGDIRYVDLDGDNAITQGKRTLSDHGDLKVIGNTTPRYSYGLNLNMNYKNWGLSMFFQGVMKRDYYPGSGKYQWFFPYMGENIEEYWLDECWSEDNRDAYFPGPSFQSEKNYESQTRFLQNAAYCRLKNLVLSYNFPKKLINKVGLQNVRISLAGTNLLTFSKIHKPLDPEYIYNPNMQYPMMKTYSANVSVTF